MQNSVRFALAVTLLATAAEVRLYPPECERYGDQNDDQCTQPPLDAVVDSLQHDSNCSCCVYKMLIIQIVSNSRNHAGSRGNENPDTWSAV